MGTKKGERRVHRQEIEIALSPSEQSVIEYSINRNIRTDYLNVD